MSSAAVVIGALRVKSIGWEYVFDEQTYEKIGVFFF